MKNLEILLNTLLSVFTIKESQKAPELKSINQKHFCDSLAISDYYCDENNLFI